VTATDRYETLRVALDDHGVLAITLDRPSRLNAASFAMFEELAEVVEGAAADDHVRAVVLTGEGPHFSAGADLGDFEFTSTGQCAAFNHRVNRTYLSLERCWKPVIAGVRGYAYGFGLEITLPCDMVLASPTARFALPEVRVGLLPAVTVLRGVHLLGRRAISAMALTGDPVDAERALQIGLVNEVVADEELDGAVLALARRLAATPPCSVQVLKQILHRGAGDDYDEIGAFMPGLLLSEDLKEGRAAFAERRPPVFRGT
jgi:enoyl-CoA hydratase